MPEQLVHLSIRMELTLTEGQRPERWDWASRIERATGTRPSVATISKTSDLPAKDPRAPSRIVKALRLEVKTTQEHAGELRGIASRGAWSRIATVDDMRFAHAEAESAAVVGFPRPVDDDLRLPAPFLVDHGSSGIHWAAPSHERAAHCEANLACQVCGEGLGETVWFISEFGPASPASNRLIVMDEFGMHERCTRLAARLCPDMNIMGRKRFVWTIAKEHWTDSSVVREHASYVSSIKKLAAGAARRNPAPA